MRVLQVITDDIAVNGLYSMICRMLRKKPEELKMDIASIRPFKEESHIGKLEKLGAELYVLGTDETSFKEIVQCRKNLVALLLEENYDAVHIHGDNAFMMRGLASAAKKGGVPIVILHCHGALFYEGTSFFNKVMHRIVRRTLVIYGTEFVASSDAAAKWMFPNIEFEDVVRIRECISTAAFHFDPAVRERVRDELDIPETTLLVGNIGNYDGQINHEFMMDVLAELMTKKPDTMMLLVGDGKKMKEVRQEAAAYGLSKNIVFMKNGKNSELMQAMDAFIFPTRNSDLPKQAIQAQAAGLPTFLSQQVSEEAKIIDTVEYLTVKKESEIEWAERIRKRRVTPKKRMQGAMKVKRAGFGVARTLKAYLDLYQLPEEDIDENNER